MLGAVDLILLVYGLCRSTLSEGGGGSKRGLPVNCLVVGSVTFLDGRVAVVGAGRGGRLARFRRAVRGLCHRRSFLILGWPVLRRRFLMWQVELGLDSVGQSRLWRSLFWRCSRRNESCVKVRLDRGSVRCRFGGCRGVVVICAALVGTMGHFSSPCLGRKVICIAGFRRPVVAVAGSRVWPLTPVPTVSGTGAWYWRGPEGLFMSVWVICRREWWFRVGFNCPEVVQRVQWRGAAGLLLASLRRGRVSSILCLARWYLNVRGFCLLPRGTGNDVSNISPAYASFVVCQGPRTGPGYCWAILPKD